MVYTTLPTDWANNPALFGEFQAQAAQDFHALDIPQGALHVFTAELAGRDQLVLTLLNADHTTAVSYMQQLNTRFPMLEAFNQDFVDLRNSPAGNRLVQLVQQVRHNAKSGLGETQLARNVLGAMHDAGLTSLDVTYETLADGSRIVRIEGEFTMQVQGHMQEELTPQTGGTAGKADPAELLLLLGVAPK
jgi:hypothetical protein